MQTVADTVTVRLTADTAQYDANLRRAEAEFDRRMQRITARATTFGTAVGTVMGRGIVRLGSEMAQIPGKFLTIAESANRAENALRAVGLEGDALSRTWDQLLVVAQKNYVPMEDLVKLYGRVTVAQKDLRASSEQIVQMTDAVALSLRIMGRSPTEARGAMLQLSQALGEGTVRAQEFNSLLENALPLLQAAAGRIDGVGGSVAALRKLVIDGKLSSEAFFRAILLGQEELERRAANIQPTVGQAWTRLSNQIMDTVRRVDDAAGITTKIASALTYLADDMSRATNEFYGLNMAMDSSQRAANALAREYIYLQKAAEGLPGGRLGAFSPIIPDRGSDRPAAPSTGWQTSTTVNPEGFPTQSRGGSGRSGGGRSRLDSFAREARQTREQIALLETERRLVGATTEEYDRQMQIQQFLNMAKREGLTLTPQQLALVSDLATQYARVKEQVRQAHLNQEAWMDLQRAFGNQAISGIEGLVDGTKKWNDVLADTLKTFARLALQAAILGEGPLGQLFGTSAPGGKGVGGLVGTLAGALFGGFFADGGHTPGRKPIIVGERGPELFMPGRAGSVISNEQLRGAAGQRQSTPVVVNNDFRDSSAPAVAALSQRIDRLERNLPNIIERVQTQQRSNNPFYGG